MIRLCFQRLRKMGGDSVNRIPRSQVVPGAVIGFLTVLESIPQSGKCRVVRCRCICDKVIKIQAQSLAKHRKRGPHSCGCKHEEQKAKPMSAEAAEKRAAGARKRGEFDLTPEEYERRKAEIRAEWPPERLERKQRPVEITECRQQSYQDHAGEFS